MFFHNECAEPKALTLIIGVAFMNETRANIHDLIERTQEALLGLGLSRQTVWCEYSSKYLPIGRFFKEHGCEHYDTELLAEYYQLSKKRKDCDEICENSFRRIQKALERIIEIHDTGKLLWSYSSRLPKFEFTEKFESVMTGFLAADEFHHNTKGHYGWVVRKYLVYLQEVGHSSLETVTAKDLQGFILFCRETLVVGSIRSVIGYLRTFHHYLSETGQFWLNDNSILYATVVRESKLLPYLTWDEIERVLNQIDRTTDIGKRCGGQLYL